MDLELFTVPDDHQNELVRRELTKLSQIPGVKIREAICPPGTDEVYAMPVVAMDSGIRMSGLDSIRRFVLRELAKHP